MPRNVILSKLMKAAQAAFFIASSQMGLTGYVLFCLSWLAYDHYRPWLNFHSETLALIGLLMIVASQASRLNGRGLQLPTIALLPLVVACVPWIQWVFGISLFAGDALLSTFFLVALTMAIGLGYRYQTYCQLNLKPHSDSLFGAIHIAALISALIGILQWLSLQDFLTVYVVQTDPGDRAMGNLGQSNQLATLLLMGITAAVLMFEKKRIGPAGVIFSISFQTLGLMLCQSRAGMLSALVISVFGVWKTRKKDLRTHPIYIATWLFCYGTLILSLPYISRLLLMADGRSMNPGIDGARLLIWKQVLSGLTKSPWFGYGWNETPTAHAAGSLTFPGSLTYTNAHSFVLDIMVWNGIPLGFLITALLGFWIFTRFKSVTEPTAIFAAMSLIPIIIHSLVEFPFTYAYFLIACGFFVGVIEATYTSARAVWLDARWAITGLLIWSAIGSCIVYEYILVEEDFRVVRFENLRIGQTPDSYEVPQIYALSHMGAMLHAARQQPTPHMSSKELEILRATSLRFSYGSLALRNALALGLNGDPVAATLQMAVIKGMYGEVFYGAAVEALRSQERDKYPQLSKVVTP